MSPPAPVTQTVNSLMSRTADAYRPIPPQRSVDQPPREIAVVIDPAIAQEGPVRPGHIHLAEIDRDDKILGVVQAGPAQDLAACSGYKALSPEFNPIAIVRPFQTNAVGDRDVAAVGDGMRALDDFPGAMLVGAVLGLFLWMPADRRWIEQDIRPLHCCEARPFRVPLVPA